MHSKRHPTGNKILHTAISTGLFLFLSTLCQAKPYTPAHGDTLLVDWGEAITTVADQADNLSTAELLEHTELLLAKARVPGQAQSYQLAEQLLLTRLSRLPENYREATKFWLLYARIQQHRHDFEAALGSLHQALQHDPANVSAQLLTARVQLVLARPQQAQPHCLALLGHAPLLTTSACALEVSSHEGKLQESYRQLNRLVEREGLPNDERGLWLTQLLADMAVRLEDFSAAEAWLDLRADVRDVSYLAQWADVKLALDKPRVVLKKLAPLVENAPAMDDALLLPLAIAEKQTADTHWQKLMTERVVLREARGDQEHAAQMARFYLDVKPSPARALHWAQSNARTAKEPADQQLLTRAMLAEKRTSTDLNKD